MLQDVEATGHRLPWVPYDPSGEVGGQYVPRRGADDCRTELKRIEEVLQPRASRSRTSADGVPPRPCSSHMYQAGLTLASRATSSLRRPGVRRRVTGKPRPAGSSLLRRSLRNFPRALSSGLLPIVASIAAQAWSHPAYSFRDDVMSDLGNPVAHDFLFGHAANRKTASAVTC